MARGGVPADSEKQIRQARKSKAKSDIEGSSVGNLQAIALGLLAKRQQELPNVITGSITTRHKLAPDERRIRRVKNQAKRHKAVHEREARQHGALKARRRAKDVRKLGKETVQLVDSIVDDFRSALNGS